MRVLIHAGFHKTGTTSVQAALRRNRDALAPFLRIRLPGQTRSLRQAARAWSDGHDPVDAGLIRYEAAELAGRLDPSDPRPVLISSEDLCGHMPGRHDLADYGAAPRILSWIVGAIMAAQPEAEVGVHFSTRAAEPWLRSSHAQHLRATRITEDADSYVHRMSASADFTPIIANVSAAVAPADVSQTPIEACSANPLAPLFDRLDLPAACLATAALPGPVNTAPPAAWVEAVLQLNRSDLPQPDWERARAAIREEDYT
ncbi:hypothetical protein [Marinibacterium sp. SX1]|uniref:hypothetical protein n=1 Tax=Marinibacterium sp. SX1 TaxID=3388424 RepID=UPI003D1697EA